MTHLENFHRMMNRDRPSWLPLSLPMTPPIADLLQKKKGTRSAVEAFDLDMRGVGPKIRSDEKAWRKAFARIGADVPKDAEVGFAGISHLVPSRKDVGKAYHFREMLHPLAAITSVNQLRKLPWPNVKKRENFAHLSAAVAKIHAEGRVATGGCACTAFESAWYLRGMDNLFGDLIEGNGISDWLLDWFTQRSIRVTRAYAKAGVDLIHLGDDVGTQRGMMMAPDFWRQHLKGRLKSVVDAIRDASKRRSRVWIEYHTDGDVRDIIDELIEIGIDILNPCQPECMPPAELVARYKDRLGFSGLVGTQTTMPFGTPDDVRAVVAQAADFVRGGAAVLLAPTHVLEPEVPWRNIAALVGAVKKTRLF
jgi:uroporphyrinogen decarboxylase